MADRPPIPPPPEQPNFILERMGVARHSKDLNKLVVLLELHPEDAIDDHANQSIALSYDNPSQAEEDFVAILEAVRRLRS